MAALQHYKVCRPCLWLWLKGSEVTACKGFWFDQHPCCVSHTFLLDVQAEWPNTAQWFWPHRNARAAYSFLCRPILVQFFMSQEEQESFCCVLLQLMDTMARKEHNEKRAHGFRLAAWPHWLHPCPLIIVTTGKRLAFKKINISIISTLCSIAAYRPRFPRFSLFHPGTKSALKRWIHLDETHKTSAFSKKIISVWTGANSLP